MISRTIEEMEYRSGLQCAGSQNLHPWGDFKSYSPAPRVEGQVVMPPFFTPDEHMAEFHLHMLMKLVTHTAFPVPKEVVSKLCIKQ